MRSNHSWHMELRNDLIIVGGGLNGRMLALAAASAGLRSVVIDPAPRIKGSGDFDGRSYALALTSTNIFRAIGLWAGLAETAQPILDIKVSEGRVGEGASPFFLHFDSAELEEGPMGYMVEDRHLRPHLDAAIDASDRIEWIAEASVIGQEVTGTGASVVLDDGRIIDGALIAACDGRGSKTAERAGITRVNWDYPQTALVCAIKHEKPHDGEAHQFFAPAGPLAVLPLQGNRSSIVWSEAKPRADAIMQMDQAGYMDALRPLIGSYLGEISLDGARYSYPLGLTIARRFAADRLVLVGDAAHGIHPLAGQGLNLGFRDTAALVEVLSDARRRGQDIGSADALRRYEIWRRPDATALALATDQLNRLFSNDNRILSSLRSKGMGLVNAAAPLRRGFMRSAAGLGAGLPRLMAGKPI